jgi:hypothetical protein
MNVHVLPNRRLLDAETSLTLLVARARALQAFGPTVDFDAPVWDLTDIKVARPSAAQTHRLFFTRIAERETRSMEGRVAFEPNFGNLLKAMIALREHAGAAGQARYRKLLQAGRHLYETLENRGFDPTRLTSDDFETAARSVKHTSASNRNVIGQDLENLAEFVNKHALAKARIVFANPYPRQRYDSKTDEKSCENRADKMPSEELIDAVIAMSDIVRERGDDRDVLRSSIVEGLMCAPWRINEFLVLLANSVRRKTVADPKTGQAVNAFGFAHDGSKKADDSIKWLPSPMVEVAERAVADIIRITQPARDVARWMETHPGRAYVAERFRLADPGTQLTMSDIAEALGLASKNAAVYWLRANQVPFEKRDGRFRCSLGDLEAAVLRLQPKLRPDMPQRLSDYLLLVPEHYFRIDMASLPCIVTFVTDAQIGGFLQTSGRHKSVFERLQILDAGGKPYVVTSHAFRHYLNTIAKDGELSELDIARWSGRKRIEQNAAYDHTGGRQLKKRMRQMLNTKAMRGSLAETVKKLTPVEREEFIKARINTAHLTDIGACIQDWSLAPCPKHGSCAGCGDHLVIKGNLVQKARAERLLAEHESILAHAKSEMDEGMFGVSDWVAHHAKVAEGLRKTVAVHNDPEIPAGTVVQA